MKTRIHSLFFVAIALSAFTVPTQAGILYWDGTSTTANADGGNGTWDLEVTNLSWDTLATGGSDSAWPAVTTLDDDAVFGGSAGTVNVDAGGVTANSLTFNTAGYVLQSGKITLDGTAPTITNAVAATITSEIAGTASFTKAGAGTLTLGSSNTYTGTTTFSAGVVNVANLTNYGVAGSLGARLAAQETAVGDGIGLRFLGGTLQYTGSTAQSTNRQIRVGTAGAVIDASGTTLAGTVSFTHSGANTNLFETSGARTITLTGSNAGDNTFAIKIENQGANATSLVKSGTGKWILTNANTYTGTTTISGGTLMLSGGANRLATTGAVAFAGSSTLDLGGNSQTLANLSVTAGGTVNNTITNGSLTLSGASDLLITTPATPTTAGAYSLDASGLSSLTISKSANSLTVGGNVAATVAQTGTFKLSSTSNTITVMNLNVGATGGTGSIVNSGTLSLGTTNVINATNVLVGTTRSNANLSFQSGLTTPAVTLRGVAGGSTRITKFTVGVNGAGGTAGNTQVADFSLGSIDMRVTDLIIAQGQSAAITGTPPSVNGTFTMGLGTVDATNIILADNIGGGGNSTNTAIFNQNAGTVTVGALTLGQRLGTTLTPVLSANYNLGTSTTTGILRATTVQAGVGTVNASSVRNINFNNGTIQNFDSATDLTINGSGTAANSRINIILAATGTHTFLADTSRTITLGANTLVSGTNGTLTKAGAGTLVMNAANTYTGATAIDAGTISLVGGADRLPAVTDLTLANTTGVSLSLNSNNQTLGSLAGGGTNGGNISLGTGILKVGNANNTTFGGQLSGTGSLVKVGAGSLTLSGNTTVSLAGMNTTGGILEITSGNYTITGSAATSAPDGTTGFVVSRGGTFRLNGGNVTATSGTYLFTAGNTGSPGGSNFILDSGTFNADGREILNAYGATGTTTINGGLFVGNGFKVTQSTGILNLNGGTLRVNRLYGDGNTSTINFNGGTLQARQNHAGFVDSTITNALVKVGGAIIDSNNFNITVPEAFLEDAGSTGGGLTKQGNGTLTLTQANTYTGATRITGGTLALTGTASITSPSIIVGASTTFDVSGLATTFALGTAQTLSGPGTVAGAMNVSGTLSPGSSPGTLSTGDQTWLTGGDYNWQVLNALGVAGADYDTMAITGTLDLSSLTASGFNINLWSLASTGPDVNGNAANFLGSNDYSWTLASATSITGFNAANFFINVGANNGTNGFSNGLDGGAFSVTQSGNNLLLNFTAVPEPRAALLGALGLLALLRRRR